MKKTTFTLIALIALITNSYAGCVYENALEVKEIQIGNLLSWSTSAESNAKSFTILQSSDGLSYDQIGTVKAGGTSEKLLEYRFLDLSLGNDETYYRLVQMDFSGVETLSQIAILQREERNNFMLLSMDSPTIDQQFSFTLETQDKGRLNYRVIDRFKEVKKRDKIFVGEGKVSLKINLEDLENGEYQLELTLNKETENIRLIKVDQLPRIDYVIKD